jgi:hypothetical protein
MPRKNRIGTDCKLLYNSATWGTPTWVEIGTVGEAQLGTSWDTQKLNLRLTRVGLEVKTNFNVSVTGKLLDDESAAFTVFDDSFNSDNQIDVLVLNGPISRAKSRGVRFMAVIKKWDESQNAGDVIMRDFEIVPGLPEDQTQLPQRAVVATPGTVTLTALAPQ